MYNQPEASMYSKLLILFLGALLISFFGCGDDPAPTGNNNDTTTGNPSLKIPAAYRDTATPGTADTTAQGYPRYTDTCCIGGQAGTAAAPIDPLTMKHIRVHSNGCNNLQLRFDFDSVNTIQVWQKVGAVCSNYIYQASQKPDSALLTDTTFIFSLPPLCP
jgi:hypothetical protein